MFDRVDTSLKQRKGKQNITVVLGQVMFCVMLQA